MPHGVVCMTRSTTRPYHQERTLLMPRHATPWPAGLGGHDICGAHALHDANVCLLPEQSFTTINASIESTNNYKKLSDFLSNMTSMGGTWGDDGLEDDYLPPKQVTAPDANGIKTIIEYKYNSDGKKVKISTKVKEVQVSKKVSKKIAERKQWIKFGDVTGKGDPGTIDENATIVSMDVVRIEAPNEPKKEASDDLIERLKEMQIKRAMGGGLRRMPRAEDVEREMNADGGSTRYVPPSLRGGRGEGERMKTRDDSATLRVTNLSSDATEQDLRTLFGHYGNVTRVYIALDRETKQSRGFAFVSFFDRAGAELAMEKLEGYGFDHLILKIDFAEPSQKKTDPGSDNAMRYASGYGKALPQGL